MDSRIGKSAAGGCGFLRKGSGVAIRDANHDRNRTPYCDTLACDTSHNSLKGTQEKLKPTKHSIQSLSGKEIAGSSSTTSSSSSSYRKSLQEQQNPASQSATIKSSSRKKGIEFRPINHRQVFMKILESNDQEGMNEDSGTSSSSLEYFEPSALDEFSSDASQSSVHCNTASSSKSTQLIIGRSSFRRQDAPPSSFVQRPVTAYPSFGHAAKPVSLCLGTEAGAQRSSLKNLRCMPMSDVVPSGCSSSGYSRDRTIDIVRRNKLPVVESSSTRSKAVNILPGSVYASPSTSVSRLSIPESVVHQPVSRRSSDRPTTADSSASVRTRRTAESRMMLSIPGNSSIPNESILMSQVQRSLSIPEVMTERPSRSLTMEMPHFFNTLAGQSGSTHGPSRSRSLPLSENQHGDLQIFNGSLGGRDGYRRFNLEGVAEVLLALERIEQDALSYEQLLVLETSSFLGGLRFYDQHRDMRLDIDNMSYEELLALGDKIGNVSTALSEEQLSKCLKTSIYTPTASCVETSIGVVDDMKCSICQEEYVDGDELGNLPCKHRYHVPCIQHWLQQKNWCPMCKSCTLPN